MTFHIRHLLGVWMTHRGAKLTAPPPLLLSSYASWPAFYKWLYEYFIGCHDSHVLEYAVAFLFYFWLWPWTFARASSLSFDWIAVVVAFNLSCMVLITGFWHFLLYQSPVASGPMRVKKFNAANQYEPALSWKPESYEPTDQAAQSSVAVGAMSSTTGQLEREMFYSTLGWLQSSAWQVAIMHLWATGRVPFYDTFWAFPAYSVFHLLFPTVWRLFHFYWIHRFMHPWTAARGPLDVGALLYRHVHALHHKSSSPGPWAGLAMHPVEHFFYYTCLCTAFLVPLHPLHVLYTKFHADISPIGGHDGFDAPGGGSRYHYLHHAHFECNYGVPLLNFDKLFGTWVDYGVYVSVGRKFALAKERSRPLNGWRAVLGLAGAPDASRGATVADGEKWS